MGRPIYNYELSDPDFSWLINSYKENNPRYAFVDASGIPISFITAEKTTTIKEATEIPTEEFKAQIDPLKSEETEIVGENK